MSSRDFILDRVRGNQPESRPLPDVPLFDSPAPTSLANFTAALERMGGRVAQPTPDGLDALIRSLFPLARVVASATPEVTGSRDLAALREPAELHDVDVGVVRGCFGVAETGSVFLSESELVVNAIGFLSQHLVVLLDPAAIVPNLHHAYRSALFREAVSYTHLTLPTKA